MMRTDAEHGCSLATPTKRIGALLGPAYLYTAAVGIRNRLYDRSILPTRWVDVPVIAVGNLTTGGTGKTPTTIFLAETLLAWGYRPGIVLRGYGASAGQASDEHMLMQRCLPDIPIIANPDRCAAARSAIAQSAQVIIADDAYQHRRLGRDLNICLIDATCPFGHDAQLPAGQLREPVSSLRRADLVIISRSDHVPHDRLDEITNRISRYVPRRAILPARHRPTQIIDLAGNTHTLNELSGTAVCAFSAIARPASFHQTLQDLGAQVTAHSTFRDHHHYTADDLAKLVHLQRKSRADVLICTAKDAVKLEPDLLARVDIDPIRLWTLKIQIEFNDEHQQLLSAALRRTLENFSPDVIKGVCANGTENK